MEVIKTLKKAGIITLIGGMMYSPFAEQQKWNFERLLNKPQYTKTVLINFYKSEVDQSKMNDPKYVESIGKKMLSNIDPSTVDDLTKLTDTTYINKIGRNLLKASKPEIEAWEKKTGKEIDMSKVGDLGYLASILGSIEYDSKPSAPSIKTTKKSVKAGVRSVNSDEVFGLVKDYKPNQAKTSTSSSFNLESILKGKSFGDFSEEDISNISKEFGIPESMIYDFIKSQVKSASHDYFSIGADFVVTFVNFKDDRGVMGGVQPNFKVSLPKAKTPVYLGLSSDILMGSIKKGALMYDLIFNFGFSSYNKEKEFEKSIELGAGYGQFISGYSKHHFGIIKVAGELDFDSFERARLIIGAGVKMPVIREGPFSPYAKVGLGF